MDLHTQIMQFEINLLFHVYALVGPELASGLCTRILIPAPGIDLEVTMKYQHGEC